MGTCFVQRIGQQKTNTDNKMSRTKIHSEIGKFHNGVIEYENLSLSTKRKFRRQNFEVGYFRNLRNEKKSKLITE